jgi:hypothetical protein
MVKTTSLHVIREIYGQTKLPLWGAVTCPFAIHGVFPPTIENWGLPCFVGYLPT